MKWLVGISRVSRCVIVDRPIHGDKPLRRRTENDRCSMPPAVRVTVLKFFGLQQESVLFQFLDNDVIGFPDRKTADKRYVVEKPAISAHRIFNRQAIFLTNDVVVDAMRRGSMHSTGS